MEGTRPQFVTAFGTGTDYKPSFNVRRDEIYTHLGLAFLIVISTMITIDYSLDIVAVVSTGRPGAMLEELVFLVIVYYTIWGGFHYHLGRLGCLRRLRSHRPASRTELEAIYETVDVPPLAVLVPSYREEERVVRQTLMSAALLEYPNRRVVLLIDDPPDTADAAAAAALEAMRRLPTEIEALLSRQQDQCATELANFEHRRHCGRLDLVNETRSVAALYRDVAKWLDDLATGVDVLNHTDKLFVDRILCEPARAHLARSTEMEACLRKGEPLSEASLLREYTRLAALFAVRLTSFERKRYVNLAHEPNKAMNLNSYIGLIGKSLRETSRSDGRYLEECGASSAGILIPRANYLITLDADSLLMNDYALRLTHVMSQAEHQQVAVVQTPYVAVPGSPIAIERAAGAQADLEWIMGQGSTHYGATFWIGASALLRFEALKDICKIDNERGRPVQKYIRDRTLTEDTESTVDLIAAGWRLYNYPDRLSYSATPPDFGALVIQRRRWANGGLLILPMLVRYLRKKPPLREVVLRTQYLLSTAASNLSVLALMVYPFSGRYSKWLLPCALSYLVLYQRDLLLSGYRWSDIARVFSLNFLLVSVNLGGVAGSLRQWMTGCRSTFFRTPKVVGRTAAPSLYIALNLAIPTFLTVKGTSALLLGSFSRAIFPLISAATYAYALVRFVGIRYAFVDLAAGVARVPILARRGSRPQDVGYERVSKGGHEP